MATNHPIHTAHEEGGILGRRVDTCLAHPGMAVGTGTFWEMVIDWHCDILPWESRTGMKYFTV
jgi:hypothetical protein